MYQDYTNWDIYEMLEPIITVILLLFLMFALTFVFMKYKNFSLVLVVYLFSMIIGVMAIGSKGIPFTPLFQVFFLVYQSTLFILQCLEVKRF